jgi:hypothetical protein
MKLTRAEMHEGGKEERKEFSRFKTIGETIRKSAIVAALAVTTAFGCGPSGPTSDGGTGGDGGSMTDGGSGTGGDGGETGLCATYQHGSNHRAELRAGGTTRPGQNSEGWTMFFKSIDTSSGTPTASLGLYQNTFGPSAQYFDFQQGQTEVVNVPGATGDVTIMACQVSSQPCSVDQPNGVVTGDRYCTFIIAADKPFN